MLLKKLKTFLRNIYLYSVIILICIIFIECLTTIALKFKIFRNFNHSFVTFDFTEITNSNFLNLKKNISLKEDISIFTDTNRLRVREEDFNHNLNDNSNKVIFLGDSVPFGWGVNYEDSIPGAFEKINKKFTVINAAVPSYTIKQSVDKFIEELKDVKNINYIYISNFNPLDLYLMFGKKWDESLNWSNHNDYLAHDIFFYKYKNLPIWGEISLFKVLRKIHVVKFFERPKNIIYERNSDTDKKFIMFFINQLERLSKNVDENTVIIFVPIMSPLNFHKNALEDEINNQRLNLINKVNNSLKLYNKNNFIYFDTIEKLNSFNEKDLFIDECCHLTPFSALEIAKNLNKLID